MSLLAASTAFTANVMLVRDSPDRKMKIFVFILTLVAFPATTLAQNSAQPQTFLQTARDAALRSNVGKKTIAQRNGNDLVLFNSSIYVRVAQANGTWDAAWLGKPD